MALADRLAAPRTGAAAAARVMPRSVRIWLWGVAALVFLMVVVGGATRLTESGLSITEWKLVSGVIPPLTEAQWQDAFAAYKKIPQYAELFPDMSLAAFKFIYSFEWFHRLLGRLIGLVFAVPLALFWIRGSLPSPLKPKLVAVLGLGALQGVVGWWMVKSGLSERVEVSQYRLAAHLLLASLTLAALVWLAAAPTAAGKETSQPGGRRLRIGAAVLALLVFVQLGLGALMAGLRAGWTYNTWPLMDGRFVPPIPHLLAQSPWWSNFFENITTVQFEHRTVAYLVLAAAIANAGQALWVAPGSRAAARSQWLVALVLLQAALGITTLLLAVPLWAGLLHQAVAMLVLVSSVAHWRLLGREAPLLAAHQHRHAGVRHDFERHAPQHESGDAAPAA